MKLIGLAAAIVAFAACGDVNKRGDDDGETDDGDGDGDGSSVDGGGSTTPGGDGSVPGGDGSTGGDAGGGFVPLITATWSLEPGTEAYICGTRTLTEDVYAGALRPIAPLGTHHTTVEMTSPSGPDDPSFPCGPEFGRFWASGVGTGELVLPQGVGLLAPAGQQLRVSLHLFNATDETLSGTSGLEARPVDASEVEHTASVDYHGPLSFAIPPTEEPHTETDQTAIGNSTLVGIFPHMHQLGTHFRAVLQRPAEAPVVLWDEDYQFESQEFAPLDELAVPDGSTLETSCTWTNTTGGTVGWGDSSNDEMCFTILMSY